MGTYSPKNPRIRRPKYTDQDVRNKVIELRDALVANLDFVEELVTEDLQRLQLYKDLHGDLRYRTVLSDGPNPTYGPPTQVIIEPLALQWKSSIASLIQSIRTIQDEIAPENDPEGASNVPTSYGNHSRASLRDTFKSEAAIERPPIQPDELEASQDDEFPAKLVENREPAQKTHISPIATPKARPEPKVNPSKPKPWRETTPKAIPKVEPTVEPTVQPTTVEPEKPIQTPKANAVVDPNRVGLSPALRAKLTMSGSGLAGIRSRYAKGTGES